MQFGKPTFTPQTPNLSQVQYSLLIQAKDYNVLDESSPNPFSSLEKKYYIQDFSPK